MAKKALITGITGQDGSYLAEFLLAEGIEVIGVTSGRSSRANLVACEQQIQWEVGDITKEAYVKELLSIHVPDEIYNLASVATVAQPWLDVIGGVRSAGMVPLYFLEYMKNECPQARFFQASSAEMFGESVMSPQDETTLLRPRNPYGAAKIFAHSIVGAYRSQFSLFACSGILFNHESPRRGEQFVTRKITRSLARIRKGVQSNFSLGNLDAMRDWGFAGDYVRAMRLMLRHDTPDDYVIASGRSHTIRECVEVACRALEMPIVWEGNGMLETGVSAGKTIITIDAGAYRPAESVVSCGDSSKIRRVLGWRPECSFEQLISMMARSDYESLL